jgi:hypothetical protein
MAMINMKKSPEREEMPGEIEYEEPMYPYGLCLHLSQDEMEKLGITALPAVGSEMTVTAKVFVKGTSAYETQGGKDMSMDLQITDMEISAAQGKADNTERATMLYGGED